MNFTGRILLEHGQVFLSKLLLQVDGMREMTPFFLLATA